MLKFYDDSIIIMDWQTSYGKLQTMLKITQTVNRNMVVTLASITTMEVVCDTDSISKREHDVFPKSA